MTSINLLKSLRDFKNLAFPISSFRTKYKLHRKVYFRGTGIRVKNCDFEGLNMIGANSDIKNSYIGRGSYINNFAEISNARIGRFCSIADHLKIGFGSHPTDLISTFPAFYYDTTGSLRFTLTNTPPNHLAIRYIKQPATQINIL